MSDDDKKRVDTFDMEGVPVDGTLPEKQSKTLFMFNLILGVAHVIQAVAILALSADEKPSIPVLFTSLAGRPGLGIYSDPVVMFYFRLDIAAGVFLLLAGVDHLATLLPYKIWPWYVSNVSRGVNTLRWIEYSISASIMMVAISLVVGVTDLIALVAIFGCNSAMILFGLMQEQANWHRSGTDRKINWWPFIFGTIIGIVPWICASTALGLTQDYCLRGIPNSTFTVPSYVPPINATGGDQCVPGFVFGVFFSLLVLFFSFAVNMWLQYARIWRWKENYFSEMIYLWLSLIAKSILAWQIYGAGIGVGA